MCAVYEGKNSYIFYLLYFYTSSWILYVEKNRQEKLRWRVSCRKQERVKKVTPLKLYAAAYFSPKKTGFTLFSNFQRTYSLTTTTHTLHCTMLSAFSFSLCKCNLLHFHTQLVLLTDWANVGEKMKMIWDCFFFLHCMLSFFIFVATAVILFLLEEK